MELPDGDLYDNMFLSPFPIFLPNGAWCMSQATFPDPDPDPGPGDAGPGGFPPDRDVPGPEQGLYITLPAGQLTLSGFSQGGASDTMAPGALLATVVDTVAGPGGP